ncbi:MAG TPA: PAS domain-containing protein [Terriglobales bacterium]|nr:PAS domain-containing protein [Terriglobales bacterium]
MSREFSPEPWPIPIDQWSDQWSQQDLRVLLDHAPDAIGRFDCQLRHVYVNEATARANNRPASDFIGKTMEDLGHRPETAATINHHLRQVFATAQETRFDILFDSAEGPRWFQCRMVPERNGQGEVEYVLCISRDITQQKQTEAALRDAETRASAAQITTNLAHEINNPLAAAMNAIYLLGHNKSLDDEARQLLEMATSSLERVANISRRMLYLYKKRERRSPGEG